MKILARIQLLREGKSGFHEPRVYTEQMDAEGSGRRLLLTPQGPPNVPEKQTLGTVTASHSMLTLQALSSSLNADTAKRCFLGQGKAVGDLRQSVPQNGRVHLLGVERGFPFISGKFLIVTGMFVGKGRIGKTP